MPQCPVQAQLYSEFSRMNSMAIVIFQNNFNELIKKLSSYNSVFLIYDENVEKYADEVAEKAGIGCTLSIEASEEEKTMETVMEIERFLLEYGAERDTLVVAMGGGITTDIVGFAASVFKRGVRFALVPTTLLSQVDAAIGGKTGVNLDSYKNMVGTFCQPEFTYICSACLESLPKREFKSGAAEMLKSFIIKDGGNYEKAVEFLKRWNRREKWRKEELQELVEAAARVKMEIVERDPLEKGERRKLNLGHTFAHAIEWFEHQKGLENPLSHGEAVAIGIVQAAKLTDEDLAEKLEEDFRSCGLPTELPYSIDDLIPAMEKDKKNKDGGIRFVLVNKIGEIV